MQGGEEEEGNLTDPTRRLFFDEPIKSNSMRGLEFVHRKNISLKGFLQFFHEDFHWK